MRGRNFQGWDVETFAEDADAATKVYFEPPEPETDPVATPALPTPTGIRSFEVDGTWRVPSLAPKSVDEAAPLSRVPASTNPPPIPRRAPMPQPPARMPMATNPPPARMPMATNPPPARMPVATNPAPQPIATTPPPVPLPIPGTPLPAGALSRVPASGLLSRVPPPLTTSAGYTMPAPASLPHFEPSILAMARPRPSQRPSRRFQRPALGVFVAAACVLVGIGVGGFLAATGHSHSAADAAPARVVMSPTVQMTTAVAAAAPAPAPAPMTVEPIIEPAPAPAPVAAPQPAPAPAPAPVAALPPPQPTFAAAPKKHHTTVVTAPGAEAGTGKLAISSKPPCSIVIDGKHTGLTAPQRAIELAAGKHEVTLINVDEGIHLTTEVAITADRSTQLIRDFTN